MVKTAAEKIKQINLGLTDHALDVTFDLFKFLETRLLIQASSGGGKSYLLRRIVEQVFRQNIPVWIVDPEGEYTTLREKFDLVIFGTQGEGDLDLKPETLGAALPELLKKGVSGVFDLSDLNLEDKREAVIQVCNAILSLSKPDWKSMLLCVDEAQIFAPEGKSSASIDAITDLASRIRKRGVGLVVATQRLSALDKNLTSHLHNRIIGYCLEDIEVARAGNYVGKKNAKELVTFEPGDFFAMGPALNFRVPVRFHAGSVETTHPDPSTRRSLQAPKATTQLEQLLKELRASIDSQKEETDQHKASENSGNKIPENIQNSLDKQRRDLENRERDLIEREKRLDLLNREIYSRIENVFTEANKLIESRFDSLKTELAGVFKLPESGQALADMYNNYSKKPIESEFEDKKNIQATGKLYKARPQMQIPVTSHKKIKDDFLHRRHRKILDTLATFEQLGVREVDKINVAVFSGVSPKSSQYDGDLRFLKNSAATFTPAGLIQQNGDILKLTNEGRAFARPSINVNSVEELHNAWCSYLPPKEAAMLRYLLQFEPGKRITRTHLAQDTNQSETSSAFQAHLSALRKFGIIAYDSQNGVGCVYLTNFLFPVL